MFQPHPISLIWFAILLKGENTLSSTPTSSFPLNVHVVLLRPQLQLDLTMPKSKSSESVKLNNFVREFGEKVFYFQ